MVRLAADICRAYAGLSRQATAPEGDPVAQTLSRNDDGYGWIRWTTTWFKGGSEPGVITLNYLARTGSATFVAWVMLTNLTSLIEETTAVGEAGALIRRSLPRSRAPAGLSSVRLCLVVVHCGVVATSNRVVWWEIESPDPAASRRFYGELFGWTFRRDFDQPDSSRVASTGSLKWTATGSVACKGRCREQPLRRRGCGSTWSSPTWRPTLARATALGASVERERTYLGTDDFWFANLRDPQGISVGLWTSNPA